MTCPVHAYWPGRIGHQKVAPISHLWWLMTWKARKLILKDIIDPGSRPTSSNESVVQRFMAAATKVGVSTFGAPPENFWRFVTERTPNCPSIAESSPPNVVPSSSFSALERYIEIEVRAGLVEDHLFRSHGQRVGREEPQATVV